MEDTNLEQKVTFTPEQQAKIDELIRERQGAAAREVRAQAEAAKAEAAELKAKLEAAQEELEKAKGAGAKKDASDEVELLKGQLAELKNAGQTNKNEIDRLMKLAQEKEREAVEAKKSIETIRKHQAMRAAASGVQFFDVDEVVKLTDENIKWDADRNRYVVLNEQGTERMNSSYELMSLEEYFLEYGAKQPYKVRGSVKNGTGGSESQRLSRDGKIKVEQVFGKESDAVLANKLKREDPKEYARLKEVARSNKLI